MTGIKLCLSRKKDDFEKCVLCWETTDVLKTENIQDRRFYGDGVGQLCESCWKKLYATDTEMVRLSNEFEKRQNCIRMRSRLATSLP